MSLPDIGTAIQRLLLEYINKIACQHFCKFKEAKSNFKNAHVHILMGLEHPPSDNPRKYTGLGHDDETPGMANPRDPKHNTVSRGNKCEFRKSPSKKRALNALDLKAVGPLQGYFHPAPKDPRKKCPEGFYRVECECGPMCITWGRKAYEKWRSSLK